jgi:penicillin-binding protein 1A
MGNDNGDPMKGVTGGGLPAKLFRAIATAGLADLPPRQLALPASGGADDGSTTWDAADRAGSDRPAAANGSFLERVLRSLTKPGKTADPAQRLPEAGGDR